ncbi:MAG: P-loop NTPase [Candidatus Micrarchaeota archaeon]|nr:P-loop NTPase [Candidatus Micrarchaeota archaeon]
MTEYPEPREATSEELRERMQNQIRQKNEMSNSIAKMKYRIAVWSGKGGVGKTTFAINLAYALSEKFKTGLLDADIDCPNVMAALGITDKMQISEGKLLPIRKNNLQIASMGAITEGAILWRGPLISRAIEQFLSDVNWNVDCLVADLPPGTSDAPLTIAQHLKPTAFIIVTTSDDMALLDAKKSILFAQRLKFPVLGIVENMSGNIFGEGGGEKLAKEMNVSFLGSLPLDRKIIDYLKNGTPLHKTEFKDVFEKIIEKIK